MDLDIYRGKGDAIPKKTNFSEEGKGKKKKKKKKKKIVSWKKTGQDLDIPQPSFLPVEHRYTSRPFAFHSPCYPLSLFISQFLRLTANYHRPDRAQA